MKRLFTFGCSFTHYTWPSWADLLGQEDEYDLHENWGVTGIGNVGMMHRIAECHSKNNFTKDDTVIVQWSTHLRHDYHRFRSPPRGRNVLGWKTKGSIFNYLNTEIFDKKWIYNFFDEPSFVMYNLNAMQLVKSLFENTGVTWVMTSIGNFKSLGSDIQDGVGAAETTSDGLNDLFNKYPKFEHYRNVLENDNWVSPIGLHAWNQQEKLYTFRNDETLEPYTDPHPSTILHMDWLNLVLKKKLGLSQNTNKVQQRWIDITESLIRTSVDTFDEEVHKQLPDWDNSYKGY